MSRVTTDVSGVTSYKDQRGLMGFLVSHHTKRKRRGGH